MLKCLVPWVGFLVTLTGATSAAWAEQGAGPSTRYSAPEACPERDEFERELRLRLSGTEPDAWQGLDIAVTVAPVGDEFQATLRVVEPSGREIYREVRDPDCQQVVRAIAFVTAVLVDPEAASRSEAVLEATDPTATAGAPGAASEATGGGVVAPQPQPAPERPAAPKRPAEAAPPEPVAPEEPEREPRWWWGTASLGVALQGAVFPGPVVVAPRVGAGVRVGERVGGAAQVSLTGARGGDKSGVFWEADFTWIAGRFEVCGALRLSQHAETLGCLVGEYGQLSGAGSVQGVPGPTEREPWIAAGALGRLETRVFGPLGAYVDVGAVHPFVRPRFYFTDADGQQAQAHAVPPWGLTAGAGLGVRFP